LHQALGTEPAGRVVGQRGGAGGAETGSVHGRLEWLGSPCTDPSAEKGYTAGFGSFRRAFGRIVFFPKIRRRFHHARAGAPARVEPAQGGQVAQNFELLALRGNGEVLELP